MVLAMFDHLVIVDGRDPRIPLAGGLGSQVGELLDQIGASLADVRPFRFALTTLLAIGNHARPTAEMTVVRKTVGVSDKAQVDRRPILADALQCFEVASGR